MYMGSLTKVPQFDMDKLPFVIFSDGTTGFFIVNTKTCTFQQLVKAQTTGNGFCLELEDGSFDFHFTHFVGDFGKVQHEAHHRVCFRTDLWQFMKEHG